MSRNLTECVSAKAWRRSRSCYLIYISFDLDKLTVLFIILLKSQTYLCQSFLFCVLDTVVICILPYHAGNCGVFTLFKTCVHTLQTSCLDKVVIHCFIFLGIVILNVCLTNILVVIIGIALVCVGIVSRFCLLCNDNILIIFFKDCKRNILCTLTVLFTIVVDHIQLTVNSVLIIIVPVFCCRIIARKILKAYLITCQILFAVHNNVCRKIFKWIFSCLCSDLLKALWGIRIYPTVTVIFIRLIIVLLQYDCHIRSEKIFIFFIVNTVVFHIVPDHTADWGRFKFLNASVKAIIIDSLDIIVCIIVVFAVLIPKVIIINNMLFKISIAFKVRSRFFLAVFSRYEVISVTRRSKVTLNIIRISVACSVLWVFWDKVAVNNLFKLSVLLITCDCVILITLRQTVKL